MAWSKNYRLTADIDFSKLPDSPDLDEGTKAGRGFAVLFSGGGLPQENTEMCCRRLIFLPLPIPIL